MISADDFYKVMCALVPLYFAMLVAYGSLKWCKLFTPEQCTGINRFVAVFAVPVLSFHFISQNNPYQMDTKFILADTLSKVIILVVLSVWAIFFTGGLDWVITLFSVATLPNTLVMGIPLLMAMYGDFTQSLMVQVVVLQCIIWYCKHTCLSFPFFLVREGFFFFFFFSSCWDGSFSFVAILSTHKPLCDVHSVRPFVEKMKLNILKTKKI